MTKLPLALLLFATVAAADQPSDVSGGAYLIDIGWFRECPAEVLHGRDYSGECWVHILIPHHLCAEAIETDCERADIVPNGKVDASDWVFFQGQYGKTCGEVEDDE